MKVLAILLLSLSFPGTRLAPPARVPQDHSRAQESRKGGKWYMAESGHAIFCYGPVMLVRQPVNGQPQKVATFCQGGKTIVPLKE
jgi:hypothetical protein